MDNITTVRGLGSETTRTPQGGEAPTHGATVALVARARLGDRRALDRLLADARPRAFAVALRVLRDHDEAEDAVQDAFMKVLRHIRSFEERARFSTWLHRIVVNTCLDRLRRPEVRLERVDGDARRGDGEDAAAGTVDSITTETPETALGRLEARRTVRAALARLSPPQRDALALRELEECSYAEIAKAVHCPVGTVMSRLFHARRRLAEELAAPSRAAARRAA